MREESAVPVPTSGISTNTDAKLTLRRFITLTHDDGRVSDYAGGDYGFNARDRFSLWWQPKKSSHMAMIIRPRPQQESYRVITLTVVNKGR